MKVVLRRQIYVNILDADRVCSMLSEQWHENDMGKKQQKMYWVVVYSVLSNNNEVKLMCQKFVYFIMVHFCDLKNVTLRY